MTKKYDAIVVGSGLGGLSAAASMAKNGLGVKLLEKHTQPGGYATTFFKDRFEFEVSLHALSGIGTEDHPGPLREQLEIMDVAKRVEFIELNELFRAIAPGLDIVAPKGPEAFTDALVSAFPHEARGIRNLMTQVRTIGYETELLRAGGYSTAPLPTVARFPNLAHAAGIPLGRVLDRMLSDSAAKLAFSQLWGYFGLPPAQLSMLMFSVGMNTYLNYGAAAIKGKSQSLSNAFVDVIRENGGEVCFASGVKKIIAQNGRVIGVETEQGDRFESDTIVANANPITTITELLDKEHVPSGFAKHLANLPPSLSAISIYLGMDKPSKDLGITDYEIYLNTTLDMDEQYTACLALKSPKMTAMCAYDLINPKAAPKGAGMIAVTALTDGKLWEKLDPSQYTNTKEHMAELMLQQVEQQFPGVRQHIETASIATPITNMRYTGNPTGAIYGYANTPNLNPGFRPDNKGPIEGLWFAGAWTRPGGGFQATIASGINTAKAVMAEKEIVSQERSFGCRSLKTLKPPKSTTRILRGLGHILRDGKIVKQTIASKYAKLVDDPSWVYPETVTQTLEQFHAERLPVRLKARIRETNDTVTLRFEAVKGELPPFSSGQYFNLFVEHHAVTLSRPYSISSPCFQRKYMDVTIKLHEQGDVSKYLAEKLRVGETVNVTGPNGDFFYNQFRDTNDIVGIAVGSGITPFMSMIEQFAYNQSPVKMTLFYGSRTPFDTIFYNRLRQIEKTESWFTLIPVFSKPSKEWNGIAGRITGDIVRRHLPQKEIDKKTFFICGPRELYENLVSDLTNTGINKNRIRIEAYGPPSNISTEENWPAHLDSKTEFSIKIQGFLAPIKAQAGVPLLKSLESAGVNQSALCRSGVCDACKMQLLSGDVFTPNDQFGHQIQHTGNQITPCMCYPTSDLQMA